MTARKLSSPPLKRLNDEKAALWPKIWKRSAYVDVVEMLGAETYLYLTVADVVTLTARVDPTVSHSKVGEVTTLAIDGNRVHLFDKETELVILS